MSVGRPDPRPSQPGPDPFVPRGFHAGLPSRTCESCGEWLPHACAAEITISRAKWTGRRVVTVRDRQPADQWYRDQAELEAG